MGCKCKKTSLYYCFRSWRQRLQTAKKCLFRPTIKIDFTTFFDGVLLFNVRWSNYVETDQDCIFLSLLILMVENLAIQSGYFSIHVLMFLLKLLDTAEQNQAAVEKLMEPPPLLEHFNSNRTQYLG